MTPKWHFNTRRACDRMRDSANDAFFTAESLENLSEALVRVALQNCLDAAQRDGAGFREVRVRIALQPQLSREAREFMASHFADVRENFARGLGVASIEPFLAEGGCVVIEDFGTRGLTGDVSEYRIERAADNAFFSFFRAEGCSAKTGDSLGRWGIGKQVFQTASQLHAMFGLTVRADTPKRVLMGSAVVRTHSVGGKDFQPDAWFGCRERDDDPVQPVTAGEFIDSFAAAFGLRRKDQTGLSVVVPAVDERVNTDDIRRGIVRSFFWPILLGELVVEPESPTATWRINAETLAAHREMLPPSEAAVIELAAWAAFAKPEERINLPEAAATKPQWAQIGEQLLPEAKLQEIRSRLERDQRVSIKIPVRVRPKFSGGVEQMSHFTVYLTTCRGSGHRPVFLHDDIVISDVRSPQISGTRSLVVVDDPPLAGLLGDAEGVNHTQWQKDSPKFHNRYFYGPDTIKFVSRSVFEIVQRLHAAETKGDPNLLLDIFYLPADEGPVERKKKPEPGAPKLSPIQTVPPPPPKPKPFILESVKAGFLLKPGNTPFPSLPAKLRIEAGYAVRRGNAIKRWAPDDFVFIRHPLRLEPKPVGVIVTRQEGNTLDLEIRRPDFLFGVSGFDNRRDLVVRAIEVKGEHETDV